jgi:hypothetical protein
MPYEIVAEPRSGSQESLEGLAANGVGQRSLAHAVEEVPAARLAERTGVLVASEMEAS